jgi:hypothetical protein
MSSRLDILVERTIMFFWSYLELRLNYWLLFLHLRNILRLRLSSELIEVRRVLHIFFGGVVRESSWILAFAHREFGIRRLSGNKGIMLENFGSYELLKRWLLPKLRRS